MKWSIDILSAAEVLRSSRAERVGVGVGLALLVWSEFWASHRIIPFWMKVVLGFPKTDKWVGVGSLEEDLRNRDSNLGPEKVVETAIVEWEP